MSGPQTDTPTRPLWLTYIALTKPRIIELLLITTVPVMFLAERGLPSIWLILNTVIGGTLAAASANTLNSYLDRDIDQHMDRTKDRPLATGEISARNALIFGYTLGALSVVWLGVTVNWLSAVLALAANVFYVVVYTMMLKRHTAQNIVWGGAAGCMPVLIGWSAVTNSVGWPAIVLFGVIFLWTPPHYWPLSMKYSKDYSSVDVPMLGAIETPVTVARNIVAYSWAMVGCSLLLIPVAQTSWFYGVSAVVLGGWFLVEAHMLSRRAHQISGGLTTEVARLDGDQLAQIRAIRLFHISISYLTLLFLAVAIEPFAASWF